MASLVYERENCDSETKQQLTGFDDNFILS